MGKVANIETLLNEAMGKFPAGVLLTTQETFAKHDAEVKQLKEELEKERTAE